MRTVCFSGPAQAVVPIYIYTEASKSCTLIHGCFSFRRHPPRFQSHPHPLASPPVIPKLSDHNITLLTVVYPYNPGGHQLGIAAYRLLVCYIYTESRSVTCTCTFFATGADGGLVWNGIGCPLLPPFFPAILFFNSFTIIWNDFQKRF